MGTIELQDYCFWKGDWAEDFAGIPGIIGDS